MKFDTPATTNPIDQLKVVGKPIDRIDGPLKTTGTAPYAYERHDVVAEPGLWLCRRRRPSPRAGSPSMDLAAAKAAPGVLAIVTAENAGKLGKGKFNTAKLLGGPEIEHYHQADRASSSPRPSSRRAPRPQLVRVDYAPAKGAFDLAAAKRQRPSRAGMTAGPPTPRSAISTAPSPRRRSQLDATYTTPDQAHAMMEPHASIAAWEGDKLTLWTSNQMIDWGAADLAKTLGIAEGEGPPDLALSSAAASAASCSCAPMRCWRRWARARPKRPVKVALQRPLMFNNTTHRPATIQRIRIGATRGRQDHGDRA